MSKIKEYYLSFYESSNKCYDDALEACRDVWEHDECDMKCSVCPMQRVKSLYADINNTCIIQKISGSFKRKIRRLFLSR